MFLHFALQILSRLMVIELVYLQISWIIFYIPKDYISINIGPGTIICGRTYGYNLLCDQSIQFDEYVHAHTQIKKIMKLRTVCALKRRPSDNTQGTLYYISLESGRILYQRRCILIPMISSIIDRVNYMATKK